MLSSPSAAEIERPWIDRPGLVGWPSGYLQVLNRGELFRARESFYHKLRRKSSFVGLLYWASQQSAGGAFGLRTRRTGSSYPRNLIWVIPAEGSVPSFGQVPAPPDNRAEALVRRTAARRRAGHP